MKMQHLDNYFSLLLLNVLGLAGIFKFFFWTVPQKKEKQGRTHPSFAKVSANGAAMF